MNNDSETISTSDEIEVVMERSLSFKKWEPHTSQLTPPINNNNNNIGVESPNVVSAPKTPYKVSMMRREMRTKISLPDPPAFLFSPRPMSERDAAAVTLQKVYKSYRTRRNLADCAVVVEELWLVSTELPNITRLVIHLKCCCRWKALDFASLEQKSVSFFKTEKPETAVSRWTRAGTRMAKVGKGLSKDDKAQKLALQHWLEAIDPRHRYGHNLHLYYDVWFDSESTQPFFYWLDVGDGKEVNIQKCLRSHLRGQCIEYLGPKERECYQVIVESGKLVYRQSGVYINTTEEDSKWIFVLSTSRSLYVGKKKKGRFQHSSFLAGGATTAAGRLVANEGVLEAIWPYSGHYHPTEDNFNEFLSFLEEHNIDLTHVKKCAMDEDNYTSKASSTEAEVNKPSETKNDQHMEPNTTCSAQMPAFDFGKRLSCKWSTGAGPRIGCVRDYPNHLQCLALEQVNLSPRITPGAHRYNGPIPSPRPSPKIRLSPRLAYMGLPSPSLSTPIANSSLPTTFNS